MLSISPLRQTNPQRNKKLAIASALVTYFACSITRASNYTATVLYPLLLPDGSSSGSISVFNAADGVAVGMDNGSGESLFWNSSVGVNLNSPEFPSTWASGIGKNQQSGFVASIGQPNVALLWNGSASSVINVNPPGFADSYILAADDTQEVGGGNGADSVTVGLLWTGASPNAIVLGPPSGFDYAYASGVGGDEQVGYGGTSTGASPGVHALLWHGSTASVVDLDPGGFTDTQAFGTDGTQQVGRGEILGGSDALLWYGTAASVVDLSPPGYSNTQAGATNGSEQVGEGGYIADGGSGHALLWAGSASSVVDLHMLLPLDGSWDISEADSIDSAGNVFGWAAGTYDGVTGRFLVEWSPVPEPAGISFLAIALAAILRRPTRRVNVTANG